MKKVKLGDKVQDRITGYKGICTGILTYLNGCRRIGIQSKEVDKGLPVDAYWVDEVTGDVIKKQVDKTEQEETGGSNGRSLNGGIPTFSNPK
jgi:hypothetical protein